MLRRLFCLTLVLATTACGAGASASSTSSTVVSPAATSSAAPSSSPASPTGAATGTAPATGTPTGAPASSSAPATATPATAPATSPAPSMSAVAINALDRAVKDVRQSTPGSEAVDTDELRNVLKAVCSAHLSGLSDDMIRQTVTAEIKAAAGAKAERMAGPVVHAARTRMCP